MFGKKIKTIVKIDGMSCEHCANKVKKEFLEIDTVKNVNVNLAKKEVIIISSENLNKDEIKDIVNNLDYKFIGFVEE